MGVLRQALVSWAVWWLVLWWVLQSGLWRVVLWLVLWLVLLRLLLRPLPWLLLWLLQAIIRRPKVDRGNAAAGDLREGG